MYQQVNRRIASHRVELGAMLDTASEDINSICKPLAASQLACTWFSHSRTFNTGETFTLSTNPEWVRYYDSHYFDERAHLLNKLLQRNSRPAIWSSVRAPDTEKLFAAADQSFNMANGLCFIIHASNHSDLFTFATNRDNANGEILFLENIELIKKFMFFYKEKASKIILDAEKKIYHPSAKIKAKAILRSPTMTESNQVDLGLKVKKYYIEDAYLTQREVDCIKACANGYNMAQTAKLLSISVATVKKHFENSMAKLQCPTKIGLIVKSLKHGIC